MAVSKAHIKASNKYNKENYKKIQANVKPEDYEELSSMIENEMCVSDLRSRLDTIAHRCIYEAHSDAFKQGFAFAVKQIKFMLKI